jgi:UDP-N-acetylglucosamine 3-dehydrogenase
MQPVRIAVFGAGYWGSKLCTEYATIGKYAKNASLVAVVDSSDSALESMRSRLNQSGISYSKDFRSVIANGNVDAVHIALPTTMHYTAARAALEAGKHVLLEKPMAPSSREAYKLASLAEERGLVLQVGHIFRFNAAVRMTRRMIYEGDIGKVFYAKLEWNTSEIPSGERDIVFDLAPHPIDVLNYLLDEWPVGVDSVGESYRRKKESLEEVAFINLEFPDRVVANVDLSWIQHGSKERHVRVVGEKGTLFCDALNQTVTLHSDKGETKMPSYLFPTLGSSNIPGNVLDSKNDVPNNTIRDMQLHFIDTIMGRGPQFNSAMIGARNVEVLEAITRAMRARRKTQTQQQAAPIQSHEWAR